jgi:Co/Zn/Cd efflux system component
MNLKEKNYPQITSGLTTHSSSNLIKKINFSLTLNFTFFFEEFLVYFSSESLSNHFLCFRK